MSRRFEDGYKFLEMRITLVIRSDVRGCFCARVRSFYPLIYWHESESTISTMSREFEGSHARPKGFVKSAFQLLILDVDGGNKLILLDSNTLSFDVKKRGF